MGQRGQDSDQRVQAGQDVDESDSHFGGFIGAGTGDAHQSADGLHQQVVARQGGTSLAAEPGDGAVDQVGLRRTHGLVVETELLHRSGAEIAIRS